ncbi:hypothetical protein [Kitasatospora sp. NBC_00458]|uniref:hypothetical protein n=1 Tax=Kitasatospora sp. NBC_00458 TaxID=2903568 RepID=UPI002E17D6BC
MAGNDDRRLVRVREHYRRRPTPGGGGKRTSGWLIAGALAVFYLYGHFVGFSEGDAAAPPPAAPTPSVVGTP